VRGDHLDDLVVVARPRVLEQSRDREVLRFAVTPRQRLVRDALHQGLEEPELPAFGRTLVRLDREELPTDEPLQRSAHRALVPAGQRREGVRRKGLAEDGGVLQQRPVLGREAVQARLDQCMERLGHVEVLDGTRGLETVPVATQQPSIEEHPDGLDGIERDPLRATADLAPDGLGEARHHPAQERLHRRVVEGFEEERRDATPARSPAGPAIHDLGPCQTEDEDRLIVAPVQEMVDEIEELGIRPLEVFEDEHDRSALRDAFDESSPGREQVVA
jgi:hypothetical protein